MCAWVQRSSEGESLGSYRESAIERECRRGCASPMAQPRPRGPRPAPCWIPLARSSSLELDRSSRSCVFPPAGQGWVKGAPLARADSPGRLRGPALTAPRRSESGLTLQRAPRGARLLPRPHEIGEGHFALFGGARRVSVNSPAVTRASWIRPASHTSGRAHVAMDEGETLPLLDATATAARAPRDADGAPIRSAGHASCSGRGSKKPSRVSWLATLGAASLGALLLAGAAVGRGGLDGDLHFTSLGEAARGARGGTRPRRRRGASRARAASSGLGDTPSSPGVGQMPRAEPIRPPQERAADRQRAPRGAARAPPSAKPRPASAVARAMVRRTRAAQPEETPPSPSRPRSSRATIRPRRRTRSAKSSTRSRGG